MDKKEEKTAMTNNKAGADSPPYLIIKLEGKERRFRFDMLAVSDFQGLTGIRLSEFDTLDERIDADAGILVALLWAGLRQEDNKLTYEKVGRMLDMTKINELEEEITTFLASQLGLDDEGEGKKATRAKPRKTFPKNHGRGKSPVKRPAASG